MRWRATHATSASGSVEGGIADVCPDACVEAAGCSEGMSHAEDGEALDGEAAKQKFRPLVFVFEVECDVSDLGRLAVAGCGFHLLS
jgi:hypothetical protein